MTLADEDTNSMPTFSLKWNTNLRNFGDLKMHIWMKYTTEKHNGIYTTTGYWVQNLGYLCWSNEYSPIWVEKITQVINSIPCVRCFFLAFLELFGNQTISRLIFHSCMIYIAYCILYIVYNGWNDWKIERKISVEENPLDLASDRYRHVG